ncbi:group 3 truncated hemoglobin ctb [mine drainage metagenome]|uniref:Group 3 truncated hemoglobin ctb n=1 Tax=mine drainage metagenome TaxID=410659 RepID=A0A1J5RZK7_9ZZZZ
MKRDIENREDIKLIVDRFYDKIKTDEVIGFIFNDIAKVNWEKHLPVMYDFWENAIFYSGTYSGNPMNLHNHLHHIRPLSSKHFDQWNKLFNETVDEHFNGEKAKLIKQRALSISTVMQQKIFHVNKDVGHL